MSKLPHHGLGVIVCGVCGNPSILMRREHAAAGVGYGHALCCYRQGRVLRRLAHLRRQAHLLLRRVLCQHARLLRRVPDRAQHRIGAPTQHAHATSIGTEDVGVTSMR